MRNQLVNAGHTCQWALTWCCADCRVAQILSWWQTLVSPPQFTKECLHSKAFLPSECKLGRVSEVCLPIFPTDISGISLGGTNCRFVLCEIEGVNASKQILSKVSSSQHLPHCSISKTSSLLRECLSAADASDQGLPDIPRCTECICLRGD